VAKSDIVSGRRPSNVAGARQTQEASFLLALQRSRKMPALEGKHRRDATGASGAKKEREEWWTRLESVDKAYQEAVQTVGI